MYKQVIDVFEELRKIGIENKELLREYLVFTYPRNIKASNIIDIDKKSKIAVKMNIQFTLCELEEEE